LHISFGLASVFQAAVPRFPNDPRLFLNTPCGFEDVCSRFAHCSLCAAGCVSRWGGGGIVSGWMWSRFIEVGHETETWVGVAVTLEVFFVELRAS